MNNYNGLEGIRNGENYEEEYGFDSVRIDREIGSIQIQIGQMVDELEELRATDPENLRIGDLEEEIRLKRLDVQKLTDERDHQGVQMAA